MSASPKRAIDDATSASTRSTGAAASKDSSALAKEREELAFFRDGEFGTYAGGPLEFAEADDEGHPSLFSIPPASTGQRLTSIVTVVLTGAVLLGAVFMLAERWDDSGSTAVASNPADSPDSRANPEAPSPTEVNAAPSEAQKTPSGDTPAVSADQGAPSGDPTTASEPNSAQGANEEPPTTSAEGSTQAQAASNDPAEEPTAVDTEAKADDEAAKAAVDEASPSQASKPTVELAPAKTESATPAKVAPPSAPKAAPKPAPRKPAPPRVAPRRAPDPPQPASDNAAPKQPKAPSASFLGD